MPKDQTEKRAVVRMLLEHHHSRTDTASQSKAGNALHGAATEELRIYLCKIIGSSGFHALFSRALKQATNRAPELEVLRLQPDGTLDGLAGMDRHGAQDAEEIILAELLELLVTFIGEGLTRRLLSDLWPGVSADIAGLISRKG
jgi:hypothetical protein